MISTRKDTAQISADELFDALVRGEEFFVVDVRNREEFDAWRIEGRRPFETINVPYFELLEEGGKDDMVDSVVAYAKERWLDRLPRDREILVVCAKGGTSEYVAEALRRLGFSAVNLQGGMIAWGDYYAVRPVAVQEDLSIHQVIRPARGCLSYVVASHGEAAVIDPLRHIVHYESFAKEWDLQIVHVFDTHGHADHISGGRALADRVGAPYHLHPYDAIHPVDVMPATISYEPLADQKTFRIGRATLKAIHIPGHTLGNLALVVNDRYVMTGDSIFIESVARPDLGGRGEDWAPLHFRSLSKLTELADDAIVLPGHFSSLDEADEKGVFSDSLGDLKQKNADLRMILEGEERFVSHLLANLPTFPKQYVDIKRVNAGLLHPNEESASELELGRNLCALSGAYGEVSPT